jgi:Protein of unknown function (DUF2474)
MRPSPPSSWATRIGWMALIWIASVVALAIVAVAFRLIMSIAGLTV